VWPPGSADTVCPRPSVTLTFDRLTLKLVCESHLRWRTFLPNLSTLGLWVLELFAMYATDGRTKVTPIVPFPTVGGIINICSVIKNDNCVWRRRWTADLAEETSAWKTHRPSAVDWTRSLHFQYVISLLSAHVLLHWPYVLTLYHNFINCWFTFFYCCVYV